MSVGKLHVSAKGTYGSFANVICAWLFTNTSNKLNETNQLFAEVTAHRATLI
jgi:hypothetical protein